MEKQKIDIIEVGPRDGFQNLPDFLPTEKKLSIIDGIIAAGVRHMQITSFVSPKAVPQMRDAREVAAACIKNHPDLDLFALVPNFRGAQTAAELGMQKVTTVISLSLSHNRANINQTHEESFASLKRMREELPNLEVCLDVATAFGCPFEGKFRDEGPLLDLLARAWALGVRTFNLCDTVGLADPNQVRRFLKAGKAAYPTARFEVHIHDTRNMGLANTLAAIEAGADGVQSTLGGLGGCPFAPGASGNTATEDLVFMLNEMGYDTGIHFERLLAEAKGERAIAQGTYSGHHINIEHTTPCTLC